MGTSNPAALRQLATQREISTLLAEVREDTKAIRDVITPTDVPAPEYNI